MYKTFIALTLTLLCSSAMAEQMYQWTDDRGGLQYGQQPPADRPYQRINIRASQPPGGELREPAPLVTEQPEQAGNDGASNAQAEQARRAQRAAECEQIRTNLTTLENNPRLSRTNADGEVERIGEDERQELISQARSDLETYCQD